MIEETALKVAFRLLKKFWYVIPIIGLAIALAISNHHLSDARKALASERSARAGYAVELGLASNATPEQIFATLQTALQTSRNRKEALDRISNEALQAHQQSVADDAALAREQRDNARRYAEAQREIDALKHRKSSGNLQADCARIIEDSKAPWKDWK